MELQQSMLIRAILKLVKCLVFFLHGPASTWVDTMHKTKKGLWMVGRNGGRNGEMSQGIPQSFWIFLVN